MSLTAGERLGPYEILGQIGAGGMGEVYGARDSTLGRKVALKVLPEALAANADYIARFRREAQVLASLNHPNIAAIYGLEENAIVMELVDGQTLDERLHDERTRGGAIPLPEALRIALQIAEALEAAHEKGIVHRDLKPGNVKITPDGVVKVLDFGLAKVAEQSAAARDPMSSPTLTLRAEEAGVIMGTPGYLAPEQAAGKPVDRRADIWAFGVVLWEMLTGQRLFGGETISLALADVLRGEIDFEKLPAGTPAVIRELIRRCLDRDPKNRLRDIGEARIAIQRYLADPVGSEPVPIGPGTPARSWLPWALMLAAATIGIVGWWRATRPAAPAPLVRFNAEVAEDLPLARAASGGMLALSPDGSRLALTLRGADGKVRLYTRLLHENHVVPLTGTENASTPFFSPDGQWIGFAADGKLKKIAVEGGTAVTLCDAQAVRGASWGDDGNIVLALGTSTYLSRVPFTGGTPTPLTTMAQGERTHRWPQVLPGSQTVIFTASMNSGTGTPDDAGIDALSTKTGERKTLQHGGFFGRYVRTSAGGGHLIYVHSSTLFAVPFNLSSLAATGPPVAILDDVASTGPSGADLDFSLNGTFVYLPGKGGQAGWPIVWLDSTGKTEPLQPRGGYYTPRLSPDGKRLAFGVSNGRESDIWVKDLDRDTPSRLTFRNGQNLWPVWTPDGKSIIFRSQGGANPGLYSIRADGAGEAQRLTDGKLNEVPYSISPDGKRLAFQQNGNGNSADIFTAAIEGDSGHLKLGTPELFLGTPFAESLPAFSPDGHWLAYVSNQSGTSEIYVRPFPGPGGQWQISTGGGTYPVWSHAGAELVFSNAGRVMAVSYTASGNSFNAGKPRVWTETPVFAPGVSSHYDLAPDGKRLVAFPASEDDKQKPLTHVTLLVNFFDELRRRAPAGR